MPTTTHGERATAPAGRFAHPQQIVLAAVLTIAALIVLAQVGELHGLAKAAGQNPRSGGGFQSFQKYLDGLQEAIIPLSIPAATLGLIGGGIAYLIGSQIAQKLLGGVVIGLGLVLLAPEIVK